VPYSAGTVFLQVVASFNDVQKSIARETKMMGPAIAAQVQKGLKDGSIGSEKAGKDAGDKYSGAFVTTVQTKIRAALKNIGDIEPGMDTSKAEFKLAKTLEKMKALADFNIGVDITPEAALAEARKLETELQAILRNQNVEIDVRTNANLAARELAALRTAIGQSIGPSAADAAEAQRIQKSLVTAEKAAIAEKAAAEKKAAADYAILQRNAARENADYDAKKVVSARTAAQQAKDAKLQEDRNYNRDVLNLDRDLARAQSAVFAARALESERTNKVSTKGSGTEDYVAAQAAIAARYAAEEKAASAAANKRIREAAKGASGEIAASEMAQQKIEEQYKEETRAAAASSAERMALARLTSAFERQQAKNASETKTGALAYSTGQAANSFRLFNGYLLAAVALGPLLLPILAGMAAGFMAVALGATLAVAGVGAAIAGLAGIGSAVSALSAFDKEKRKQTTGSGAGNAAIDTRGLRDAQIALARARQDSGARIISADKQQEQAERSLTRAVKDAATAQRDLILARQQAAQDLEDINNRLADGVLQQQQAMYDLQAASYTLNNVLEDPQATAREKAIAQLSYDQQVQSLKELVISNERLKVEVADRNAAGIEGATNVQQAEQNVVDTTQAVADAQDNVATAADASAKARIDEARTISDAEQRVADAMVDLQAKSVDAGVAGSAAMDALNEAMGKLSPAGQTFARFLYGLKPLLDGIRAAGQSAFLPGLQESIQLLVDTYGPSLTTFIADISKVLGDLATQGAKALTSPFWQQWFSMMAEYAPIFLQAFGQISGSLLEMIAGVLQAFAPFSKDIGDAFVSIAQSMAGWGKNLKDSQGFADFLGFVRDSAPKVNELMKNLGTLLVNLLIGLAPYSQMLLDLLVNFTDFLVSIPPDQLGKIAIGVMVLVGALQALAGVVAIISSVSGLITGVSGAITALTGGAAATTGAAVVGGGAAAAGGGEAVAAGAASGPIGWIILGVAAAVAALVLLYQKNEWFRAQVDAIWAQIVAGFNTVITFLQTYVFPVFNALWNLVIKPVFDFIVWEFTLFQDVVSTVFGFVVGIFNDLVFPVFNALWTKIVQPTFSFIGGAFNILWQIISTVFNMIFQILTYVIFPVFQFLYDNIVKPIFTSIGDIISGVWNTVIKPVFDLLGGFIRDTVAPAFQTGIDAIARIWNTLIDIAKVPVRFVVDTIINRGIIDTFNKLVDIFPGMSKVDHVSLPEGFASGGILPGYTPGRDVHRFYSPTAGMLDLSGGEGIARPELVARIGKKRWAAANAAARAGRPDDGVRFLGGFSDGGILGWIQRAASSTTDVISGAIGSVAGFLSDPAGTLRKIVETLIGTDNHGWAGLVASVPLKIVDGIAEFMKSLFGAGGGQPPAGGGFTGGWQSMEAVLRAAFPGIGFSSAFRPGSISLSGNQSYHAIGRAVDIAPPAMSIFNWLSANYPNSRELLYTPAGASRQILGGFLGAPVSPALAAQHENHIHWAFEQGGIMPNLYDNGGYLPPGLSMVANQTGKPEPVFTPDQLKGLSKSGGNVYFTGDVNGGNELARRIAEEIAKRRRDVDSLFGISQLEATIS